MNAPQHILDQYAHDSFRKESDFGASVYDLVISGNPLDVYGMSTGRPWSSCADMTKLNNDGADDAAQSMDEEIHNHTHVVYLVTPGGSVRNNAIARRAYKLHVSEDNATLLPDTSVYEDDDYNIPINFKKVADNYMRELFKIEKGVYILASGLYKDGDHIVYDDGEGNGLDSRKMTKKQLYDLISKMSTREIRYVVIENEDENKKILNKLGLTTDLYYSKIPTDVNKFNINVSPERFFDILPSNLINEYPNLASMLEVTPFGYLEYLVKKVGIRDTDTMINTILKYGKKNNKSVSDIIKTPISDIFTNVKCSYKIGDFITFDELNSYLTVDTVHENDIVDVVSKMSKQQWNESKDKINLDTRQLALIIIHGTSLANEILKDRKYIDLIKHNLTNPNEITAILKIALKQNYYIQDTLEENNITV